MKAKLQIMIEEKMKHILDNIEEEGDADGEAKA